MPQESLSRIRHLLSLARVREREIERVYITLYLDIIILLMHFEAHLLVLVSCVEKDTKL